MNRKYNKTMEQQFSFAQLPQTLAQLQALPEAAMTNPFAVAALTVAAFCRYGTDRDACLEMLNFLRGPRPLLPYDVQFLRDRLGGKEYKPFSFFAGAVPGNNYTPSVPYVITISGADDVLTRTGDRCQMLIRSGGADSPRPVDLRRKGDGTWWLWEQYLLSDIRTPVKDDPWA